MKVSHFTILLILLLSLNTINNYAQSIQIDGFNQGNLLIEVYNDNGYESNNASHTGADIIGGERDVELGLDTGTPLGSVAIISFANSRASFAFPLNSVGTGIIVWDGGDNAAAATDIDYDGLGGLDLTNGGNQPGITLGNFRLNGSPANLEFIVYSDITNFSTFTQSIPVTSMPVDLNLPYNSFTTTGGTGADFTNVGALKLQVTCSNNIDLVFTDIRTFPVILPVELTNFSGRKTKEGAILDWQTASEINNEGFEIQWVMGHEQLAMGNWETIGFVSGRGTTNEVQNYQFMHDRPAIGTNYYRLKQMDFDGKFEYSDIQSVRVENGQNTPVQIFPNPVKDGQLTVKLDDYDEQEISIQLYDLTGRTWLQQTSFTANTNLNVNDLAAGIYLIEIAANGKVARQKVVIE